MNTNELKRPSEEDSADSKRLKAEIDTPTEKICYPRLVINGIPKFWGMNESKKFLAKLGVTYKVGRKWYIWFFFLWMVCLLFQQVRKVPNKDVCFVVFLVSLWSISFVCSIIVISRHVKTWRKPCPLSRAAKPDRGASLPPRRALWNQ